VQTNQLTTTFALRRHWPEPEDNAPVCVRYPALDSDVVEGAARALFEFVFFSCGRLKWETCDDQTKEGFRGEARVVIEAILPRLFAEKPER